MDVQVDELAVLRSKDTLAWRIFDLAVLDADMVRSPVGAVAAAGEFNGIVPYILRVHDQTVENDILLALDHGKHPVGAAVGAENHLFSRRGGDGHGLVPRRAAR